MTDHPRNGHAPVELAHVDTHAARAAERLAQQTASLRELLHDEDAVQERLRTALDESKVRQHGLQRAINALDPQPKETTKRGPGRSSTREHDGNEWSVSERKVEQVMSVLVARGEPVTGNGLANGVEGLSVESVRRAFIVLREQGRIRLAGRSRGGGKLYAPMPEELEQAGEAVTDAA